MAWPSRSIYLLARYSAGVDLVNGKLGGYAWVVHAASPTGATGPRAYHHGDLRRALIDAALNVIDEDGLGALSLRQIARRVGVSHAAPVHHFGDKAGLLTAVATEGFVKLSSELRTTFAATASFLEVGVAYVRFAIRDRASFEVMFRPELYHSDDAQLRAAQQQAREVLFSGASDAAPQVAADGRQSAAVAAWALVHGLATLLLAGNLPAESATDPEALARSVASHLFAAPTLGRQRLAAHSRRGSGSERVLSLEQCGAQVADALSTERAGVRIDLAIAARNGA